MQPALIPNSIDSLRPPEGPDRIHVGHYYWRPALSQQFSGLRLRRNPLRFKTQSVTSLEQQSSSWIARLSSRVFVQKGTLSRLQLMVPPDLQAPFRLEPEQIGVIEEVTETPTGKQFDILLTNPVQAGEQQSIEVCGSLSLAANRSLTLPSMFWSNATARQRYVLLPTIAGKETINWLRSGLRRTRLPLSLAEMMTPTASSHCFRIQGNQFAAKQRVSQGEMRNALVRYERITGLLEPNGEFIGTAEILVQPGRATKCTLELPPKAEMQRLVIGDQPLETTVGPNGKVTVTLGPPYLPQRLLVNYRCRVEKSGDQVQLIPPRVRLGGKALPISETYWQISTATNLLLRTNHVEQTIARQEVARRSYDISLKMLQDAFSQVLELPKFEGRAWASVWQSIVRNAEYDFQLPAVSTARMKSISADYEALLALEDTFLADEKTTGSDTSGWESGTQRYPLKLKQALNSSPIAEVYCFSGDASGKVVVEMSLSSRDSLWQWFAAAVLVGGVLAVVLKLRNHPECYHDLCHWPHGLATVAGFAWWLLLKPSVLGLLIILLVAISLTLRQWISYRTSRTSRREGNLATTAS